jgi:succinoglycan biosynthesis protein ExoH
MLSSDEGSELDMNAPQTIAYDAQTSRGPTAPVADDMLRKNSKRLSIARLLLIVLVVYVHFPLDVPQVRDIDDLSILTPAYLANATFLRFSVTILTIMSGFIMFSKGSDLEGMTTVTKKVKTILVPFLFWNISLVALLFVAQSAGVLSGQRLDLVGASWQTWADALFSYSTRPVNYPLYFLRDLFVISVIAVLIGRVFRKYPVPLIVACMVVAEYNLDGHLILRTPMLPAFFIGGAIALWRVPLDKLDSGFWVFAAMLLAMCCIHYFWPSQNNGTYIAILGGLTIWTLTARLANAPFADRLLAWSKYAFPIYLMHGIAIFAVLAIGFTIEPTVVGLLAWLIVPLVVAVACAVAFRVFSMILPKFASFVTGGRGA